MKSDRRIGISMRVVQATGYAEPRDALSQQWAGFMAQALPGTRWLPIPNLGAQAVSVFCAQWELNGLILSGGDDIGHSHVRDETELELLEWAERHDAPVLGICRGMQLMCMRAGAELVPVQGHVRTRHVLSGERSGEVNSFHAWAPDRCPMGFRPLANAPDGVLEAVAHGTLRWEGWMWHPERETLIDQLDAQRLQRIFE
ncbi:gamma-glutamyl-gamma-aminobutyrate hydrolase [Achromobacter sp. B7]|uniref:gamma-glutamyl-gamma-aminobutyrate hydrolase family protein n=1 Tax=Achromobacter sp. B7 TaxID=2282475 RepID=UPI000E7676BD|nr:gamma-glutamyl-gamma-aminobutyrate hydrolase family protein [Achromobacter sp. B7]AYD67204.1 gamma-glutamyl-gamma-aminobutyrate hydrolase [Achromobacter sp. B7]